MYYFRIYTGNRTLLIILVVRPGFEPGLFWTKTRRVASYTIGQFPFAYRLGAQIYGESFFFKTSTEVFFNLIHNIF